MQEDIAVICNCAEVLFLNARETNLTGKTEQQVQEKQPHYASPTCFHRDVVRTKSKHKPECDALALQHSSTGYKKAQGILGQKSCTETLF